MCVNYLNSLSGLLGAYIPDTTMPIKESISEDQICTFLHECLKPDAFVDLIVLTDAGMQQLKTDDQAGRIKLQLADHIWEVMESNG